MRIEYGMILDRVTSLADLAFRGKMNKYYRQVAILVAAYYGVPNKTWGEAITCLHKVATIEGHSSCADIVRGANYFRDKVGKDFVEQPEQLELTPQWLFYQQSL